MAYPWEYGQASSFGNIHTASLCIDQYQVEDLEAVLSLGQKVHRRQLYDLHLLLLHLMRLSMAYYRG